MVSVTFADFEQMARHLERFGDLPQLFVYERKLLQGERIGWIGRQQRFDVSERFFRHGEAFPIESRELELNPSQLAAFGGCSEQLFHRGGGLVPRLGRLEEHSQSFECIQAARLDLEYAL